MQENVSEKTWNAPPPRKLAWAYRIGENMAMLKVHAWSRTMGRVKHWVRVGFASVLAMTTGIAGGEMLDKGVVAHWSFDDTKGTEVADLAGGESKEIQGEWNVYSENEVEEHYASIAYVATVRTASGSIIRPDDEPVLAEATRFTERFSAEDLIPERPE